MTTLAFDSASQAQAKRVSKLNNASKAVNYCQLNYINSINNVSIYTHISNLLPFELSLSFEKVCASGIPLYHEQTVLPLWTSAGAAIWWRRGGN